jgi:hypothetical protein
MADLFVSFVAITPKPSQTATQSPVPSPATKGFSGLHSDLQATKIGTPGQPK